MRPVVAIAARPLILRPEQIHSIARGRVTLMLLPRGDEPGAAPPYRAGGRYALQRSSSTPARHWIYVRRVTDVALGEIDDEQACELGHRDIYALQAAWLEQGWRWDPHARAWLIAIEYDDAAPSRLLHRDSSRGYTDDPLEALRDEPEAVDDFALATGRRAAHRAEHKRFEQLLAQRASRPLAERVALIMRDSAARGVPVSGPLAAVAKQLAIAERRVYAPADRDADAEVRPGEPQPARRRRLDPDARERAQERRQQKREREAPSQVDIRRVDPADVAPGEAARRQSL